MEEKKSSSGLIVVIIILVVLVIALIGFIVYDKVIKGKDVNQKNDTEEVINNDNNENDDNSALDTANELVKSYFDDSKTLFSDLFSQELDDNTKALIAINKTTSKTQTCDTLYKNSNVKKTEESYYQIYYNNNEIGLCEEKANSYEYNDVNSTYKKLFGQNKNMAKNKVVIEPFNSYDFVDNKFIELRVYGGTDSRPIAIYKVDSANLSNGVLNVQVLYKRLELEFQDDGLLHYKNDKFDDSTLDDFVDSFPDKYESDMDTYEMLFKLENDHYILESVTKK